MTNSALVRVANEGNPAAEAELARRYITGQGLERDVTQAFKLSRESAMQGNARGERVLGYLYSNGFGVSEDDNLAVRWFEKAALQGDADAEVNLGILYDEGRGIQKDYEQANYWWRKAADQGDADAEASLGDEYANGRGVQEDYEKANYWYRKAARQGNLDAEENLGVSYSSGRGVPRDYIRAVRWLEKAARQGDANALAALGANYEQGLGVPENHVLAYMFYDLAAARSKEATVARDQLARMMSPTDVTHAQSLAANWTVGSAFPADSKDAVSRSAAAPVAASNTTDNASSGLLDRCIDAAITAGYQEGSCAATFIDVCMTTRSRSKMAQIAGNDKNLLGGMRPGIACNDDGEEQFAGAFDQRVRQRDHF